MLAIKRTFVSIFIILTTLASQASQAANANEVLKSALDQTVSKFQEIRTCADLVHHFTSSNSPTEKAQLVQTKCGENNNTPMPKVFREGLQLKFDNGQGGFINVGFDNPSSQIINVNGHTLNLLGLDPETALSKIENVLPKKYVSKILLLLPEAKASGPVAFAAYLALTIYLTEIYVHYKYDDAYLKDGIDVCEKVKLDPMYRNGPKNQQESASLLDLQKQIIKFNSYSEGSPCKNWTKDSCAIKSKFDSCKQ